MFFLLTDYGMLPALLAEDYSYTSRAILVIYLGASLHLMLVSYQLSLEGNGLDAEVPERTGVSHVQRHFHLLGTTQREPEESGELLLDVLDGHCRGRYRFGYVVADLMLKLGLLGTVIGFIFMLGALVDLNSIDIDVMQRLLAQMSGA